MGVRTIAVALLAIFFIVVLQVSLAGPLTTVSETINETGDLSKVAVQAKRAAVLMYRLAFNKF